MSKKNNLLYHVDKSVNYFLIYVIIASLGITAFKYNKYKPCNGAVFSFDKSTSYREGDLVKFTDNSKNASEWKWDFNDGSELEVVKEPIHIFKKAGKYKVKLIVNGICEKEEEITIREKKKLLDPNKFPKFEIPESITVGETLTVSDKTPNASTWEWRFGETANINSKSRYAKYIYKEPGLKTISLIVNGDVEYIAKKRINVLPIEEKVTRINPIRKKKTLGWDLPEKPKGVDEKTKDEKDKKPKSAPLISTSSFKKKLYLVSKKQMNPKKFATYFCGDINKKIVVNGKNTTFLVFCEDIKGNKIKIRELSIFREENSNCIKTLTINFKKKGLWHILQ